MSSSIVQIATSAAEAEGESLYALNKDGEIFVAEFSHKTRVIGHIVRKGKDPISDGHSVTETDYFVIWKHLPFSTIAPQIFNTSSGRDKITHFLKDQSLEFIEVKNA